ncbi:MAG: hypothetical protein DRO11_03410 [Methanobacteriota archaeon]|nr:MAG: hypothetical protein DRO11_03410 [Euryarchaeota archaeon]
MRKIGDTVRLVWVGLRVRGIRHGLALLVFSMLLSFVSLTPSPHVVGQGETVVTGPTSGEHSIDCGSAPIQPGLHPFVEYQLVLEAENSEAMVEVFDETGGLILGGRLTPGEEVVLSPAKQPVYLRVEMGSGVLTVSCGRSYPTHPYGWLSVPAFILAIVGVLLAAKAFPRLVEALVEEQKKQR